MLVYIVNFILCMVVGILLGMYKEDASKKNKIIYLVYCTVQLGLLCGCRSVFVAYDTQSYFDIYDQVYNSWEHLFSRYGNLEIGYTVLNIGFKTLGIPFRCLLILSSLFITSSWCLFIYRHSRNVLFSVFLILCFPYYYYSFDIMRHFIAVSFVLLGYKYVKQRKIIPFAIFIILGSLFQRIALIFIVIYIIEIIPWNKIWLSILTVGSILTLAFQEQIYWLMEKILHKHIGGFWYGEFAGGIKTMIMYGTLAGLALFVYYKDCKEKTKECQVALGFIFCVFASSIMFVKAAIVIRILLAFLPFMAVGFPELLCNGSNIVNAKRNKLEIGYVLAVGLAYHAFMMWYNVQNVIPYRPFWFD